MKVFEPDFQNIVDCAYNKAPKRLPLYEHIVSPVIMEQLLGVKFAHLQNGAGAELDVFFRNYCRFFREYGYDTVSFERTIGSIMPRGGCLRDSRRPPAITCREDFEAYPWDTIPDLFFGAYGPQFEALRRNMPEGMRAVGGPGYGIFECVQNVVGYTNLCYLAVDDPELYAALFRKVGDVNLKVWERFLDEFGDLYCVCRFGDDLGFKSSTLLSAGDIRKHIIPQYSRIIDAVHRAGKPFLLHSCGCIFDVMEDLITAGIDAKHSNEDQIAPFPVWVEKYGDRIGNFGGIDTDAVCRLEEDGLRAYILPVLRQCVGRGGFAFGSGNSIPEYVPAAHYAAMIRIVREYRGDFS